MNDEFENKIMSIISLTLLFGLIFGGIVGFLIGYLL